MLLLIQWYVTFFITKLILYNQKRMFYLLHGVKNYNFQLQSSRFCVNLILFLRNIIKVKKYARIVYSKIHFELVMIIIKQHLKS